MYALKPILKPVQVDLPNCMYTIKSIYASDSQKNCITSTSSVVSDDHNSTSNLAHILSKKINDILKRDDLPLMEALELRQQNILQQLAELRQQLTSMRLDLGGCNKPVQPADKNVLNKSSNANVKPINTQYLDDVVINVSPNHVPYSLLAIKCLWRKRVNINFECFTHSTISTLTDEAKNFQLALQKTPRILLARDAPNLKISLIWKDVGVNTEMIGSSTTYVHGIIGEVNIIRYLSRVGPNEFSYENDIPVANECDIIFDICYQLIKLNTVKERQNYLRMLNSRLGKSKYFGNAETLNLADVAVCSTIKQLPVVLTKDLSPNMVKWMKDVTDNFGL